MRAAEPAEAGLVFLTRPHLADHLASAEEIGLRAGDLFRGVAGSTLAAAIDRTWPPEDARLAHEAPEGRTTRGKLLLEIA